MVNQSPTQHLSRHRLGVVMLCLLLALLAACGGDAPAAAQPTTVTETSVATTAPVDAPAQPTVATTSGCEAYFQFCNTIRGSLTAEATIGSAGKGTDCPTWAASDAPRILELPFVVAAGASKVTVALTRVGAYVGPGTYALAATTTTGMPDAFPALEVDGRTFSNGEGSAAVVTVAADGSGTIEATGLVELASIQVANPDPDARIDFSMTWTCQG